MTKKSKSPEKEEASTGIGATNSRNKDDKAAPQKASKISAVVNKDDIVAFFRSLKHEDATNILEEIEDHFK